MLILHSPEVTFFYFYFSVPWGCRMWLQATSLFIYLFIFTWFGRPGAYRSPDVVFVDVLISSFLTVRLLLWTLEGVYHSTNGLREQFSLFRGVGKHVNFFKTRLRLTHFPLTCCLSVLYNLSPAARRHKRAWTSSLYGVTKRCTTYDWNVWWRPPTCPEQICPFFPQGSCE